MTGEIYSLDENGWKWTDSLWKALETGAVSNPMARMWGKKRTGIVSVVGAGGKTTVIRRLREECLAEKIPHIVSTTTYMQTGPEECFVKEADLEQIETLRKIDVFDYDSIRNPYLLEDIKKYGKQIY